MKHVLESLPEPDTELDRCINCEQIFERGIVWNWDCKPVWGNRDDK